MNIKAGNVLALLNRLVIKCNQPLDYGGLKIASLKINQHFGDEVISHRYLHENLFLPCNKSKGQPEKLFRFSRFKLGMIAQFLGFENFSEFEEENDRPVQKQLLSFIGNWYSIVRCNTSENHLLIAPVQIYKDHLGLSVKLHGKNRIFSGKLKENAGCLFLHLLSQQQKELLIIFKIGLAIEPNVIQGVFSGISSLGDPICGREVLIRIKNLSFEEMKYYRVSYEQAKELLFIDDKIIQYFFYYKHDYVKITGGGSFELDDLAG